MKSDNILREDKFFETNDEKKIWQRYCGFLDLSLEEFMEIQNRLLMEQIDLVSNSILGKKIMQGNLPKTIDEFRRSVPLTTYEDYEPYLSQQREDVLAEKPYFWCHSSGRGGKFKWFPYTHQATDVITKRGLSLFILASAHSKGEINFRPRGRALLMFPPRPYLSGSLLYYISKRFSVNVIPPQDEADELSFQDRIAKGFGISLTTGVDVICAIASVLVKMGETMAEQAQGIKLKSSMLQPSVLTRLIGAYFRSKAARRAMLPKDLWRAKAILVGGTDARIYKEQIAYYWGQTPYESYSATETSAMAMQSWNKKWMTFIPDSAFFEFILEDEFRKNKEDPSYHPKTVLLNGVEPGKTYEVIITNFYGMPLLRYRMRDLVTFVALNDEETGINLPQAIFKTRCDDVIPLAGLAQLDERTTWQAIENSGLKNDGWSAIKEYDNNQAYLRLYIELRQNREVKDIEKTIDQNLQDIDIDYKDINKMLGLNPIRVTLLSPGTFNRYYEEKQKEGADLAHLKPPHMNASNSTIQRLIKLSQNDRYLV